MVGKLRTDADKEAIMTEAKCIFEKMISNLGTRKLQSVFEEVEQCYKEDEYVMCF